MAHEEVIIHHEDTKRTKMTMHSLPHILYLHELRAFVVNPLLPPTSALPPS